MLDVLLCYYIVANMRHAGYVVVAGDFLRWIKGRYHVIRATAARRWNKTATAANGTQMRGPAPPILWTQEDWMQGLARLDTYVSSMG
jgi:hypothetical protein